MTPEAQRIAIAEACPRAIKQERGFWFYHQLDENGVEYWHACKNNDPLSDLNAVHEAEKVLTDTNILQYIKFLSNGSASLRVDVAAVSLSMHVLYFNMVHATAAQRAEAFLRTLNLWQEDDKRATIAQEAS